MADRIAIRALCAAVQSAEGTPASPTLTANRIPTIGPVTFQINDLDNGEVTDEQDGGLGATRQMAKAGRWVQFDVTVPLKGTLITYATSTPAADPLWRAAGCSKTTGAYGPGSTQAVIYTTLDAGTFELATCVGYTGSTQYTITDCIAKPKLTLDAGKRGTITFTVIGLMPSDPVDAAIGTQSADTVPDPIWRGAASTIGAVSGLRWKKLEIDFGTQHTIPAHAGATDAIAAPVITNRQVTAALTIEKVALSTFNPYVIGRQVAPGGAANTALATTIGSALYNTVLIGTNQWAFSPPQNADNGGIIDWPLSGRLLRMAGGNASVGSATAVGREIAILYA